MNMGYADMLINALANVALIGVVVLANVALTGVVAGLFKVATWICRKARAGEKDKPGAAQV